jgi:hypothetical protein
VGQAPAFKAKPSCIQDKNKLIVKVEVSAKPTPSVSWFLDSKDLSDSPGNRYAIKNEMKSEDSYISTLEITVRLRFSDFESANFDYLPSMLFFKQQKQKLGSKEYGRWHISMHVCQ